MELLGAPLRRLMSGVGGRNVRDSLTRMRHKSSLSHEDVTEVVADGRADDVSRIAGRGL